MTAPAVDLQSAIFSALVGDAALTAAIGGRIHDHAPANVAFPYITFGRTSIYDWSTASEAGVEQLLTLHVWSKARGKAEVLAIMALASARLDDAALALADHHLVNLRLEAAEASFDDDHSVYHGVLRLRAVTEPKT